MGNSAPTAEDGDGFAEFDGVETLGYRVLGVQPNSPASSAGLVSFFDFLVGANGRMLLGSGEGLEEGEEYDDIDFPALLQENKGKAIELLVWNIKSQEQRFVDLTPDDTWGGAGLLGVTIRLDNYGGADERLIRVLEVEGDSPASVAGLVPMKDYLLGTTAIAFGSTKMLADVLDANLDKIVEIYVYNSDSDKVRVISLMPTYAWGGRGMLGAEVGTGYLHRLPNSCRSTVGQSVERKVRLTRTPVTESNSDRTDHKNGAGGEASEHTLLELEPHLEMEVEKDANDMPQAPEDTTKQPHQLGTHPTAQLGTNPEKNVNAQNQTSDRLDTPTEAQATNSKEATTTSDHHNAQTGTTPRTITSASSEDAEALFAGPPPGASSPPFQKGPIGVTGVPNPKYFMPAPPKMTY
mmetsp:Transcript_15788/g.24684  ORF Transcript_15788/g.24684 Transcript_15788/m.24684 type:complete len:408 (-) Transcript_15788:96-1319(-)